MAPSAFMKRSLIFVHRWLGIALCVVFLLWFPSGIGMMYWTYPDVSRDDRLERAPALDPSTIKLSPAEALKALGVDDDPGAIRLNTFDGRPVYRIGGFGGQSIVYADTGGEQLEVAMDMVRRAAAAWTGQKVETATVEEMTDVDQWTVQTRLRDLQPLYKFSFPTGEPVYISANTARFWSALCRLVSAARGRSRTEPFTPTEALGAEARGLLALAGPHLPEETVALLREAFGRERLFLAIHDRLLHRDRRGQQLQQARAARYRLEAVVTGGVRFARRYAPAMAKRISSVLGVGFSSRSALAIIRMPGVQNPH